MRVFESTLVRGQSAWSQWRLRALVFVAALVPMLIWLLVDARLARPWQAAGWAGLCALLAAAAPGRWLKWGGYLQILMLPLTLGWLAAVAVTGMGPSTASLGSVTNGAYREVMTASRVVMMNHDFRIVASAVALAVMAMGWALWRAGPVVQQRGVSMIFLLALVPGSAAVLDVGGFREYAKLAGSEARVGVVWLSHLEMLKEAGRVLLNQSAMGGRAESIATRSAGQAVKTFDFFPGVGVFIVGESLRADALMKPGRGPWSERLAQRLDEGLGLRLPDACAGGNGTFVSYPRLVTAVDVADEAGAARGPTLLAIAKAAGARTAYLNNHEIWVVPEAGHDFTQKISSMDVNTFDEVAIEAMGDFLKRTDAPSKAVLIHLYGQHFFYEQRYPAALFPGEPKGLESDALSELRYQRAAEYGAKVLLQAAQELDRLSVPAFLVFTSDHGEHLPSDGTGKRFHAGPTSALGDSVVPVLVLWNKAFRDSGRQHLLDRFGRERGLIAHQDAARAWLALSGRPGGLEPSPHPQTWGALDRGQRTGPVSCSELKP
ncbi:sulfatase-like hydrolase/transferase [Zoogloea dura]|uniref:Sulfatase-like hydrolase/transferase n=1 Tax=Zoogloea dura TaxID=2728840 RepID=A0A848G526_9RHOO|nr:sulfatase-like hydrolase/transferase [Zoogloea dura]NML26045.1 sulfatase-like hydrolase/transferase [Zoogloea dura]